MLCEYTLTIYLCGHYKLGLSCLCQHSAHSRLSSVARGDISTFLNSKSRSNGDYSPAELSQHPMHSTVLRPYRCQGEGTNECLHPNWPSWTLTATTAIQEIKQQAERLKTELGNVIMFLSNKQGVSPSDNIADPKMRGLGDLDLDTPAEALTTTLLNHQDVAETLYDILYRYRRLVKGNDSLIERLDRANTPHALRNCINTPFGRRQQSIDALKTIDNVLAAATERIRLGFPRAGCGDADADEVHGKDVKDGHETFGDIIAATIVTLCKARSALALLKIFMVRFGGYTSTGVNFASGVPTTSTPNALPPDTVLTPAMVEGRLSSVTLESLRGLLPTSPERLSNAQFREDFFDLTGMKLANDYSPSSSVMAQATRSSGTMAVPSQRSRSYDTASLNLIIIGVNPRSISILLPGGPEREEGEVHERRRREAEEEEHPEPIGHYFQVPDDAVPEAGFWHWWGACDWL